MLNQNLMSTHNKGISNLFYKRDPGYKPTYIITLLHLENQHFHCSLFLSFRFLVITKALWISRGGHTTVLFLFTQSESEQLMPIFLSKFSPPYQVIAFPPLPSPPLPLRSRQFFCQQFRDNFKISNGASFFPNYQGRRKNKRRSKLIRPRLPRVELNVPKFTMAIYISRPCLPLTKQPAISMATAHLTTSWTLLI